MRSDDRCGRWSDRDPRPGSDRSAGRHGHVAVILTRLLCAGTAPQMRWSTCHHSDSEIAASAMSAVKWDVWGPGSITAKVHKGSITLEGHVEWNFQRDSAERAVRYLSGVVSVFNNINLKPTNASAFEVKEKVQAALQRQATADANSIEVETSGGTVTLSGKASSWHAIEDASSAA
ncbi:MAG: BON domain-containing protein [Gemmatimonadaceae bacterium]